MAFHRDIACVLQVFGDERAAVIEGLPSLVDSSTFFQTDSTGPAHASLENMQQDIVPPTSSDDEEAAQDMDQTDLPAPAEPVKQSAGWSSFVQNACRLMHSLSLHIGKRKTGMPFDAFSEPAHWEKEVRGGVGMSIALWQYRCSWG